LKDKISVVRNGEFTGWPKKIVTYTNLEIMNMQALIVKLNKWHAFGTKQNRIFTFVSNAARIPNQVTC
jgi:hypothetical protein